MIDRLLMVLEVLLLIWVVVQGEIIVKCERGVYRLQKEREDERRQWRESKRRQQERRDSNKTVLEVPSTKIVDRISQEPNVPGWAAGILQDMPNSRGQ